MPLYHMHLLNAFLLAVVLIVMLNPIARRFGLVDLPNMRKLHNGAIPVTGGLAMFGGFMLPVLSFEASTEIHAGFLLGLLMLVVIGAIDDIFGLSPWQKLAGQITTALIMVLPGHHVIGISDFVPLLGPQFPQIELVLTVLFVVGTINALNMIDGLDGLAGGAAGSALLCLAVVAWLLAKTGDLVHLLLALCAVIGFLVFNMRHPWRDQAAVFMGDAGSMMLGAVIAFFTIDLAIGAKSTAPLPALLWFTALPVFDTLLLIARRLGAGGNPFCGDRRHLHHLLLEAGISPRAATAWLTGACLVLGVVGLGGVIFRVPHHLLLLGLIVPFSMHAFIVLSGSELIRQFWKTKGTDESTANPALLSEAGE